jgi:hypothetical protein
MQIEFRDIPGIPLYVASSDGRIYRKGSATPLTGKSVNGYRVVKLSFGPLRKYHSVNRLVCLAFHGEPPHDGMQAAHLDSIRDNNRPSNLKWKTRKENVADKIEMGTTNDGARNGMAKLTAEQALAIRHSAEDDALLADRYGVLKATIGNIKNGRSWKCLNPEV